MSIPLFNMATSLEPLRERIEQRVIEVLRRGTFILGPEVAAFEREFAEQLGAAHAVGVANGTDALTLALRALGVGEGDEVVVPSFTFYASAEAIPPAGARPVFCDIDRETLCVTPETVKAAVTPRTKAVIAVDLFGNIAPSEEIREATGLPVIEDAAQAAGSTRDGRAAGVFGDLATFSFYPSKNLGCFGDGGAIVTGDEALAERVRMLRFHGSRDKVTFEEVGYNSRLDEVQAAILREQLPALAGWAAGRAAAGRHYAEAGLGELCDLPVAADGAEPAWHLFVIRHRHADALAAALCDRGIQTRAYYRVPVHRQPAMAPYANGATLPVTDEVALTNLAIPMSPVLEAEQARAVVDAVRAARL